MRASRHSIVARVAQPAPRVDATCWQLFRPDINTAHFYFLLQKLCQVTWLLTGWKNFSLLPEALSRPEARGICHVCHMVNPALYAHIYTDYEPPLGSAVPVKHVQRSTGALQRLTNGTSVIAYMCVQRVHLIMAKPRSEQMAPLIRRASQTPSKLVIISCDRDLVKTLYGLPYRISRWMLPTGFALRVVPSLPWTWSFFELMSH